MNSPMLHRRHQENPTLCTFMIRVGPITPDITSHLSLLLALTFTSKVSIFPGNFGCIGESASGKIITNCKIAINAAQCTAGAERPITGKVNFTSLRWKQPVTAFNYVMVGTENINGSEVAHGLVRVTIMYDMI